MRTLILLLIACVATVPMSVRAGTASTDHPRFGNSAWVYDALYHGDQRQGSKPGSFVAALNRYNAGAAKGHAITRVFPYGGSLEMYCHGGPANCTQQDLHLVFNHGGRRTVAAYSTGLHAVDGQAVAVVPIIDASIRAHYAGSLHGFNKLSPKLARGFADRVAERLCADPQVDGVQFDLEPFDVSHKNGQYYFYRRIAEDFASDRFHCVDAAHPDGRTFSIFGAAHDLDPSRAAGQHLKQIMNAYHNGYFIVALYDLSSQSAGHPSSPATYQEKAKHQAALAVRWANKLGVPYQLGVPASASTHEYAGCSGRHCHHRGHPPAQLAYLRAALDAIAASGARKSPLYLGTAVWAWSHAMIHDGMRFSPSVPTRDELRYLQGHL